MSGKEQALMQTRGSIGFAMLHALLSFVEELAEEREIELGAFGVTWAVRDRLFEDPAGLLAAGRVRVLSSRLDAPVERSVRIGNSHLEILIEPGFGDIRILELYRSAYRLVSLDAPLIRSKASRTTNNGTEYMFIYIDTGEVAMFEGEAYRVRLPFVEATATVHTHPEGSCGLSRPDIQSGLDLLVEGGLLAGAATPTCIAYMGRVGLVSEDDYVSVKELLYHRREAEVWSRKFGTLIFGIAPY